MINRFTKNFNLENFFVFIDKTNQNLNKIINNSMTFSDQMLTKFNQFKYSYSLLGLISDLDKLNNSNFIPIGSAVGIFFDLYKYNLLKKKDEELNKPKLKIIKAVGKKYLDEIIKNLMLEEGITGGYEIQEKFKNSSGTNMFKEGYFLELDIKFENGKNKKIFYKYSFKNSNLFDFNKIRPIQNNILKNKNKGSFYRYIEGQTLEEKLFLEQENNVNQKTLDLIPFDKVFDKLFQFYKLYSDKELQKTYFFREIKKNLFHEKLVSRLGETKSSFIQLYDDLYNKYYSNANLTLIHGDLHQGNIFDGDDIKLIDWDNSELNFPYKDFIHFTTITDFDRSSNYEELKNSFLKIQNEFMPNFNNFQMDFIEIDTYLSFLNRYYDMYLKSNHLMNENTKNKILSSCKYLQNKTKKVISRHSKKIGVDKLESSFEQFSKEKFGKLENIIYEPNASVAYLHKLNQIYGESEIEKSKLSLNNWKEQFKRNKSENLQLYSNLEIPKNIVSIMGSLMSLYLSYEFSKYGISENIPLKQFIFAESVCLTPSLLFLMSKNKNRY